ncbi:hypothetical protein ACJX0J_027889, partial [Zea mays]
MKFENPGLKPISNLIYIFQKFSIVAPNILTDRTQIPHHFYLNIPLLLTFFHIWIVGQTCHNSFFYNFICGFIDFLQTRKSGFASCIVDDWAKKVANGKKVETLITNERFFLIAFPRDKSTRIGDESMMILVFLEKKCNVSSGAEKHP